MTSDARDAMGGRCLKTAPALQFWLAGLWVLVMLAVPPAHLVAQESNDSLTEEQMRLVRAVEERRIEVIEQVVGSVIAVYGPDRQGGGSGVIIDPGGIALTNHHVIEGAGMHGFGGLNDGKLYEWDLIGTDPGGDVAIIRMKGKEAFPYSPLGDSDRVRIGDWALAMGNPFLLAHDQVPTVTLGVVSGVERFQEGMGAQLVYGNCIQTDSSINPGNSGGPLFNMQGEVIGINGRGSFRDRGRVNVGLGYAISSNQIRNFIPDLLATKIVEHGTLDAAFTNRSGKVVCSTIDLDSPAAKAGLELGDELLEFEGRAISYANQFKNLICTLPEDWPAMLKIRKEDGTEKTIHVRMYGLPYNFQPADESQPAPDEDEGEDEDPEDPPRREGEPEQPRGRDNAELKAYLLNEPGVVVNHQINAESVAYTINNWKSFVIREPVESLAFTITDEIFNGDEKIGSQVIHLSSDGRFVVEQLLNEQPAIRWMFDGKRFFESKDGERQELDLVDAKVRPGLVQAMALVAPLREKPLEPFGNPVLDGGDKCLNVVASRIMWLDEDEDWFYAWLSLYDHAGRTETRLLKVSSDKDCSGNSKGITFADYRPVNGIMIPWQKQQVRGLEEFVEWTARTVAVESIESIDESLFETAGDSANE